jgi:DNA-binding NarL/FixJ family response regulator
MTVVRLVTIDTRAIFRAGIRQICASSPDITIVGESSHNADAIALCERQHADIVVLDGTQSNTLSVISHLRECYPDIKILLFVEQISEFMLHRAMQLGVMGYLFKDAEALSLIRSIRDASCGLRTIATDLRSPSYRQEDGSELDQNSLSEREQAVLELLMHGISNDAIATRLCVSRSTVKFHLRNIYSKLGVRSRAEALAVVFGQRPIEGLHDIAARRAFIVVA